MKPTTLDHSFEIYVPTQCRCGKPLPEDFRADILDEVKSTMAGWFGGGSAKKVDPRVERIEGSWVLGDGTLAKEPVDVVQSFTDEETCIDRREDFTAYVAQLANRLSQEAILCRIDGKTLIFPSSTDPKPHRCAGGATSGTIPNPRPAGSVQRMMALQAALQRLGSTTDIRDLFCNLLHYGYENEIIPTSQWTDAVKQCLAPGVAPQIVADQNGFKIIYLQLADGILRKSCERQLVQRILKDNPGMRGLVVVSDVAQKQWNLVNVKFAADGDKQDRLVLRRMRVGPGQAVRTAVERLINVDIETVGEGSAAAAIQDAHDRAFDVEMVTKQFFNEIANWYFWALPQVEFPGGAGADDEKLRATSLIRLLTRLIFCWFLKEKGLIPGNLFEEKAMTKILTDIKPKTCTYYQGILQNLFFATLNQRMGKAKNGQPYRSFATDEGFQKNRATYGVDTLYRYEEYFIDPATALNLFADVPFLNGGLFECLDRTDDESGNKVYVDGFSRNKKKRAKVPNTLFFSGEQSVDLSEDFGDPRCRNAKVRGLLRILHSYNFTVTENTPVDEEVALDPELLGKVFENLLASYNEETKTTARKQTGSFYTPRPIVEYMVDESLKAHLIGVLTGLGRKEHEARMQLDILLSYKDQEASFSDAETDALLDAIHTCKILDPACGSGAFPIGMLQKLVHVIHKLDPDNARWKQLQIDGASAIPDISAREAAISAIERDFEDNLPDFGRKLYLIENCLYGVDIQPIAIQISKLRFFISLICEQNTNRSKKDNYGIRPLPNLETKFVAADTLIGLPKMDQMVLVAPRVHKIEAEIESLYHSHFSIQRRDQKLALQRKLKDLRKELGRLLSESLMSPAKSQHLADWDPFDPQASSDFFDPHWMFGRSLIGGFDIVFGNPPYVQIQKFPAAQKAIWQARGFETYAATADIYCLFYERGAQLLKDGGHLCYITSNKWMRAGYGEKLREFLATKVNTTAVLDFGMAQNFGAATTYTCVTSFAKQTPTRNTAGCYASDTTAAMSNPADYFTHHSIPLTELDGNPWVVLSPERYAIKTQVEAQGVPLEKWKIQINYGIKTGFNDAFYLTQEQRDAFVAEDPRCSEFLVPLLRGRYVERYATNWDGTWMINSHNGVKGQGVAPVNLKIQCPLLWRHLAMYEKELSKRQDKGDHWSNLRNCAYLEEFFKPKIIYPNMTKYLPFYFDRDDNFIGNQKCFIITSKAESLLSLIAVLNSSLFRCCFRDSFPELLGNTYELSKIFVDKIPIKKPTSSEVSLFERLVPLVQFANADAGASPGTAAFLEDLIDACVMECYFREHMAERDLLFHDAVIPHLASYDPKASERKQREFLEHFHSALNAKDSKIRNRLERISKDSPDLLAVIKEEGRV